MSTPRVVLRARDRSWIQVSSLGGDYRAQPHAAAPATFSGVPNWSDLELWTGNAGGLEVIVNGAAAGTARRGRRGRARGAARSAQPAARPGRPEPRSASISWHRPAKPLTMLLARRPAGGTGGRPALAPLERAWSH